jgi:hypothetical protein
MTFYKGCTDFATHAHLVLLFVHNQILSQILTHFVKNLSNIFLGVIFFAIWLLLNWSNQLIRQRL